MVLPLESLCLSLLAENLEHYTVERLSSAMPARLRLRLLHQLPVLDICRLEGSAFITDGMDVENVWQQCWSFNKRMNYSSLKVYGWPHRSPRDQFFTQLCSLLVNFFCVEGSPSSSFRKGTHCYSILVHMLFTITDREHAMLESVTFSNHDCDCKIPARHRSVVDRQFGSRQLMELISQECHCASEALVFMQDSMKVIREIEPSTAAYFFLKSVKHLVFCPSPIKEAAFSDFALHILRLILSIEDHCLVSLQFNNCKPFVINYIAPLLAADDSNGFLKLESIGVFCDEQIPTPMVNAVSTALCSILTSQRQLNAFAITNWQFSWHSSKCMERLLFSIIHHPSIRRLSISNTTLPKSYSIALLQRRQFECLTLQHIEDDARDCSLEPTHFRELDANLNSAGCKRDLVLHNFNLKTLSSVLSQSPDITLDSLELSSPSPGSELDIHPIISSSNLAHLTSLNMSGIAFREIRTASDDLKSILQMPVLRELHLDECCLVHCIHCFTNSSFDMCTSLQHLSLRRNCLGHALCSELDKFFRSICSIKQLSKLDISSNAFSFFQIEKLQECLLRENKHLDTLVCEDILVQNLQVSSSNLKHQLSALLHSSVCSSFLYTLLSSNHANVDYVAAM